MAADGAFKLGTGDPVIACGFDGGMFGGDFALLGEQEIVGAFEHGVVVELSETEDVESLWENGVGIGNGEGALGAELAGGFTDFRTDIEGELEGLLLRTAIFALNGGDASLALIENGNLQGEGWAGDTLGPPGLCSVSMPILKVVLR